MCKGFALLFIVLVVILQVWKISGHGMVLDPVNRGSRWRYDSTAPRDYDDSQSFCGGYATQWEVYGGKCGFCGDSYGLATPRPHEHGGTYGKGVITKTYRAGATIPVGVQLTANHQGYFRFNLCKMDGLSRETDACFNQYPLTLGNGASRYYISGQNVGWFNTTVRLPSGLSCNHCVLQWTYNVGNSWGVCENGQGAMGCGAQENFRTCSDIRITAVRAMENREAEYVINDPVLDDIPMEIDEIIDNNVEMLDTNAD